MLCQRRVSALRLSKLNLRCAVFSLTLLAATFVLCITILIGRDGGHQRPPAWKGGSLLRAQSTGVVIEDWHLAPFVFAGVAHMEGVPKSVKRALDCSSFHLSVVGGVECSLTRETRKTHLDIVHHFLLAKNCVMNSSHIARCPSLGEWWDVLLRRLREALREAEIHGFIGPPYSLLLREMRLVAKDIKRPLRLGLVVLEPQELVKNMHGSLICGSGNNENRFDLGACIKSLPHDAKLSDALAVVRSTDAHSLLASAVLDQREKQLMATLIWDFRESARSNPSISEPSLRHDLARFLRPTSMPQNQHRSEESFAGIAICTRILNGAPYLEEWLDFHAGVGVGSFYLFVDPLSTDGTADLIESYASKYPERRVRLLDHPALHTADAREAQGCHDQRDYCRRVNPDKAKYILPIDSDEFVYSTRRYLLHEHFEDFCDPEVAYFLMPWRIFGSSVHMRTPLPEVEGKKNYSVLDAYRIRHDSSDAYGFPARAANSNAERGVFRGRAVFKASCRQTCCVHECVNNDALCTDLYFRELQDSNTRVKVRPGGAALAAHMRCVDGLHVNHYATKSAEEYLLKFRRGKLSTRRAGKKSSIEDSRFLISESERDLLLSGYFVQKSAMHRMYVRYTSALMPLSKVSGTNMVRQPILDERILHIRDRTSVNHGGHALMEEAKLEPLPSAESRFRNTVVFNTTATLLVILAVPSSPKSLVYEVQGLKVERRSIGMVSDPRDWSRTRRVMSPHRVIAIIKHPVHAVLDHFSELSDPPPIEELVSATCAEDWRRCKTDPLSLSVDRKSSDPYTAVLAKCGGNGWCGRFQNAQTFNLVGDMFLMREEKIAFRSSSAHMLHVAKHHLLSLDFFGIEEALHASRCLFYFTAHLNIAWEEYCTTNPKRAYQEEAESSTEALSSAKLSAVESGNALDCFMYEFALEVFRKRVHYMEQRTGLFFPLRLKGCQLRQLRPLPPLPNVATGQNLKFFGQCGRLARTFKYSPECGDAAPHVNVLPLLVTGSAFGSTKVMNEILQTVGLVLLDDGNGGPSADLNGTRGLVSWKLAIRDSGDLKGFNFGQNTLFKSGKFQGTFPKIRFQTIWHQYRHPLLVINSILRDSREVIGGPKTEAPAVARYETFARLHESTTQIRPPANNFSEHGIRIWRSAMHWVWWNEWVAEFADYSYRVEDIDPGLLLERSSPITRHQHHEKFSTCFSHCGHHTPIDSESLVPMEVAHFPMSDTEHIWVSIGEKLSSEFDDVRWQLMSSLNSTKKVHLSRKDMEQIVAHHVVPLRNWKDMQELESPYRAIMSLSLPCAATKMNQSTKLNHQTLVLLGDVEKIGDEKSALNLAQERLMRLSFFAIAEEPFLSKCLWLFTSSLHSRFIKECVNGKKNSKRSKKSDLSGLSLKDPSIFRRCRDSTKFAEIGLTKIEVREINRANALDCTLYNFAIMVFVARVRSMELKTGHDFAIESIRTCVQTGAHLSRQYKSMLDQFQKGNNNVDWEDLCTLDPMLHKAVAAAAEQAGYANVEACNPMQSRNDAAYPISYLAPNGDFLQAFQKRALHCGALDMIPKHVSTCKNNQDSKRVRGLLITGTEYSGLDATMASIPFIEKRSIAVHPISVARENTERFRLIWHQYSHPYIYVTKRLLAESDTSHFLQWRNFSGGMPGYEPSWVPPLNAETTTMQDQRLFRAAMEWVWWNELLERTADNSFRAESSDLQKLLSEHIMRKRFNVANVRSFAIAISPQRSPSVPEALGFWGDLCRVSLPLHHAVAALARRAGYTAERCMRLKPLKFIHVTKTGGTAIEDAAFHAGVMWGRFDPLEKQSKHGLALGVGPWWHEVPWQRPINLLVEYDWFMVARNPYDRIVSEYHCEFGGVGSKKAMAGDAEDMDEFVYNMIGTKSFRSPSAKSYGFFTKIEHGNHYTPQYLYSNDGSEVDIRVHVLKYENLASEFEALMQQYNLTVRLPSKPTKSASRLLSRNNFSDTSKRLIEARYSEDFLRFGYDVEALNVSEFTEKQNKTVNIEHIYYVSLPKNRNLTRVAKLESALRKTNLPWSRVEGVYLESFAAMGKYLPMLESLDWRASQFYRNPEKFKDKKGATRALLGILGCSASKLKVLGMLPPVKLTAELNAVLILEDDFYPANPTVFSDEITEAIRFVAWASSGRWDTLRFMCFGHKNVPSLQFYSGVQTTSYTKNALRADLIRTDGHEPRVVYKAKARVCGGTHAMLINRNSPRSVKLLEQILTGTSQMGATVGDIDCNLNTPVMENYCLQRKLLTRVLHRSDVRNVHQDETPGL